MPTLKEYLEEQRKAGTTPYFTNIPSEAPPGAFTYEEDPFTVETERMFEDPLSGLAYSEDVPGVIPEGPPQEFSMAEAEAARTAPPPKPTAETVTPGGEIPEAEMKRMGLSGAARWAIDQKIPKPTEAIPAKPTEAELEIDFEDRRNFREHSGQMALKQFGINPLTYNHPAAMEEAKAGKRMQGLFQKVLMGRSSWSMRDKLPPELKKLWAPHEHRLMGQMDAEGKDNLKLAKQAMTFDMEQFDNIQKTVGEVPTAVRNMLKSIRRKVDPDDPTKFYTEVKQGEEAYMIERASEMVREGRPLAQVISTIQTATLDNMERKQQTEQKQTEAKAAIPGAGGWVKPGKEEVDAAKIAVEYALSVGIPREEIETLLRAQEWKDAIIPNLFPEGLKKPVLAQAAVPRETAGAPKTLRQVKEAWQNGDYGEPNSPEAREKAKKLMNQIGKV